MKTYQELLDYEYDNRAVAYASLEDLAAKWAGTPRGDFCQAYYELEILNKRLYAEQAAAVGSAGYPTGFSVNFRVALAGLAMRLFVRNKTASFFAKIIIPYIPQLEQLRDQAKPEHREFFEYVVAQEKTQLDASTAAKEGDWAAGAKVLRDFVARHQS